MDRNKDSNNSKIQDFFDVIEYGNILSLGIFPSSKTMDVDEFVLTAKTVGYKCYENIVTSTDGNLFALFNICLDDMIYISGKLGISSFWVGRVDEGVLVVEYWEKTEPTKKYNKKKNNYILVESTSRISQTNNNISFIGDHYGFSLNRDCFKMINENIEKNISAYREKYPSESRTNKSMIEHSMNPLGGYSAFRMRCYLNK